MLDKPGGIFVRRSEQISMTIACCSNPCARLVLETRGGTLGEQMGNTACLDPSVPPARAFLALAFTRYVPYGPPPRDLLFANGLGGFTPDGQ